MFSYHRQQRCYRKGDLAKRRAPHSKHDLCKYLIEWYEFNVLVETVMYDRILNSRLFQRFWDFAGAASIRVKVLGIVIGVIVLLGVVVTLQMRMLLFDALHSDLEEQGVALSAQIAGRVFALLDEGHLNEIAPYLRERQAHYSNEAHNTRLDYIIAFDARGNVLGHSYPEDIPPTVLELGAGSHHRIVRHTNITDITTNIPNDRGTLRAGFNDSRIWAIVDGVTLRLVSTTLVMVAVGFGAAFFLTWILTRPIISLVEATEEVRQGNYAPRVPQWANDELGALAQAFNAMTEALAQADQERTQREQLRIQYINGVIIAQEDERKRIARELHDSTSQSLTSLLVGLQNLKNAGEQDEWDTRIEELRKIVGDTLDEVRTISWRLRPSVLDDLGLVVALERYIAEYQRRYNLPVDFVASGIDERLAPELETSIYRIVQEGLTNIARYAQANNASILIDRRNGTIRIIIEDDGTGFNPDIIAQKNKSLGLHGIRERARLFGGTLTIESQSGKGTSLFVELQVEALPQLDQSEL